MGDVEVWVRGTREGRAQAGQGIGRAVKFSTMIVHFWQIACSSKPPLHFCALSLQ